MSRNEGIIINGGSFNGDNYTFIGTQKHQDRPTDPNPAHKEKIRIMLLSANPDHTSRLRIDRELRAIRDAVQLSRFRDCFDITVLTAARSDDVRRAFLHERPHFFHFSGHGTPEGIILEHAAGTPHIIPLAAFAATLKRGCPPLQCVVLNACDTIFQAHLVATGVPFTIAMPDAILDRAAIEFAKGFYDAIGAGRTVPSAYDEGRSAVEYAGLETGFAPQLLTGSRTA